MTQTTPSPVATKVAGGIALLCGVLMAVIGWYTFSDGTLTFGVPEARLQKMLESKLPLTGAKKPFVYEVTAATVKLEDSGRVRVSALVTADAPFVNARGSVEGSAGVRYANGAFFLEAFAVDATKLTHVKMGPVEYTAAEAQGNAFVRKHLRGEELADTLRGWAESTVQEALAERPIYTLDPLHVKQAAARLSLKAVSVHDGVLWLTVDPVSGTAKLLLYLVLGVLGVLLVLAILVAVARSPVAGLFFLTFD